MSSLWHLFQFLLSLILLGVLLYAAFVIGIVVLAVALGLGIIGFLSLTLFAQWQLWQARRHGFADNGPRIIEVDYIVSDKRSE